MWHCASQNCADGAPSPGSAFARGLPQKPAKWIDHPTYCDAMEPLLRLAARDKDRSSNRTGEDRKLQVR